MFQAKDPLTEEGFKRDPLVGFGVFKQPAGIHALIMISCFWKYVRVPDRPREGRLTHSFHHVAGGHQDERQGGMDQPKGHQIWPYDG